MDNPRVSAVRTEVDKLARGRRKLRFLTVLGRVGFYALCVLAALAFAVWGELVSMPTFWMLAGVALGVVLAVAAGAAWLLSVDHIAVAKRYDDRVGTKDLLSSSLELTPTAGGAEEAFVAVVQEDAVAATGRATSRELYPSRAPTEVKWMPLPAIAGALALALPIWLEEAPPPPDPATRAAMFSGAEMIDSLLERARQLASALGLGSDRLERMRQLEETLRLDTTPKRKAMSELARLASQLDKERKELESRKMQVEKNAAKLAKGEDAQDVRRDMDAGKYREAANKIKKKLAELEKKLEEAIEKKAGKMEIEKLRKRVEKLRTLLAELESLDALGKELGFLVETLEVLERIEGELGELGELGEYDGDEFDEVELGRARRPGKRPEGDDLPRKLFAMPSNEAGEGHSNKVLGKARRALTEGDENEVQLREGKGKSAFGQVKTANDGSRSRTAYEKAFLAAKRAADDAIYRQDIPAGYRNYIRRYFETMQPDERTTPQSGK